MHTPSPSGMVLAASGVDHASFVSAAEASFGSASGDAATTAASPFLGGEVRVRTTGANSFVALAFQGGATGTEAAANALVLEQLVTGAFSVGYSDTGLFGVYGSCAAGGESALVDSMVASLKSAAGGVSAGDFAGALAKASLAANVDSAAATSAGLGSSLLLTGTATTSAALGGVTAASVSSAAAAALKSAPAVASIGALTTMPGLATIQSLL